MRIRKKLTPQEEKFCLEYSAHGNATRAMICAYPNRAKWAEASRNTAACRLLVRPHVQQRLEELKQENAAASLLTREDIVKILSEVIMGKRELTDREITIIGAQSTTIQKQTVSIAWAIDRLCKLCGYEQPQKHEITGKDGKPLRPEPITIEIIDRIEQVRRED